jgi:hypothetical protein
MKGMNNMKAELRMKNAETIPARWAPGSFISAFCMLHSAFPA